LKKWPKELIEYHTESRVSGRYVWLYVYEHAGKKTYHLLGVSDTAAGLNRLRKLLKLTGASGGGNHSIERARVIYCGYNHLDDYLDRNGGACDRCDECIFRESAPVNCYAGERTALTGERAFSIPNAAVSGGKTVKRAARSLKPAAGITVLAE
jgi:hypothetical protein